MNRELANTGRLSPHHDVPADLMIPTRDLPPGYREPVVMRDGTVIAERRAMRTAPIARGNKFRLDPPRVRLRSGRWRCRRR